MILMVLVALLVCSVAGVVLAQGFTQKEIRNPRRMEVVMDTDECASVNLSVTNGQAVTLSYARYILTGVGGANDTTNTITLANATDKARVTLIVSAASTNLITIADSAPAALSAAWLGDNLDAIVLEGVGTNWVQTSGSNN
jgi:hypothetical protein